MKINKKLRIKAAKRIYKRLSKKLDNLSPYDHTFTDKLWSEIEHWEMYFISLWC